MFTDQIRKCICIVSDLTQDGFFTDCFQTKSCEVVTEENGSWLDVLQLLKIPRCSPS